MPRVPVYDRPRVSPGGFGAPVVRPAPPDGTEQLGQAVAQLGVDVFRVALDARDRADRVRVDQELLRFRQAIDARSRSENGVLRRQGESALDFDQDWDQLTKDYQASLRGLASDRQREMFGRAADALLARTRSEWDSHAAEQFLVVQGEITEGTVAQIKKEASEAYVQGFAAVDAKLDEALVETDANGNPVDDGALVRWLRVYRGLPEERVQQLVEQYRKEGHLDALRRFMAPGAEDVEGAKAYLEAAGELLGNEADPIRRAVEKEETKRLALKHADEAFQKALQVPPGRPGAEPRVNQQALLEHLDTLPPEQREEARALALRRAQDFERAFDAKASAIFTAALSEYNQGGMAAVSSQHLAWLNVNAPDLERRLRDAAKRDAAEARGSERERIQLRNERDGLAIRQFKAMPLEEQMRVDVAKRWGGYASEIGLAELQVLKSQAAKAWEKGDAIKEKEFLDVGIARAAGSKIVGSKKKQEQFKQDLLLALNGYRTETGGKHPSREEAQKMIDDVLGAWGVEPPREIVGYRVSPDGIRRVPEYSDGTFGPEEVNPNAPRGEYTPPDIPDTLPMGW